MNIQKDELREFIAVQLTDVAARKGIPVTITDELHLLGEHLLDSLDFLNLLLAIEERFHLEADFSEMDIAEVTRFGALVDSFFTFQGQHNDH